MIAIVLAATDSGVSVYLVLELALCRFSFERAIYCSAYIMRFEIEPNSTREREISSTSSSTLVMACWAPNLEVLRRSLSSRSLFRTQFMSRLMRLANLAVCEKDLATYSISVPVLKS